MVEIKKVETKKDLKKFIKFQHDLYKDNEYFVPPMIFDEYNTLAKDKNSAFEFCEADYFLAYKNGEIVGRIAALLNHKYVEIWKNKYARFGWVDFIDDEEVVDALFDTVENWAKEKGMEAVHGPLGFCDFDFEGMLVDGFDQLPTIATIYNHPYYPKHLERRGYIKDADWNEFLVKTPKEIPERLDRIAKVIKHRRKLKLLDYKKGKDLFPRVNEVFELLENTYKDLYGVTPLNQGQVDNVVDNYITHVSPDFAKFVLDENDKICGFVIGIPSLSRAFQKAKGKMFPFGFIHVLKALKKPKHVDLMLGAVREDLQGKGVDVYMTVEMIKSAIKNNVITTETNPELETNKAVQAHWKHFDAKMHKTRRCFIKKLQ